MTSRTVRFLLPVLVFALVSCSKTEDSAPERRLFGDPPTIQSVEDNFFDPAVHISCDFTEIVRGQVCDLSGGQVSGDTIQFQDGGVLGSGVYGEAIFRVQVTDPNSTTDQSNILMVAASYIEGTDHPTETSLVLFDDGSETHFDNQQRSRGPLACSIDESTQVCKCEIATFPVTSGDPSRGDGTFYRKMAIVNPTTNFYLQDCIMRDKQENIFAPQQSSLTFTVEAVDRQGNLATWPSKLSLTRQTATFQCTGDPCGCCFLLNGPGLQPECSGLPGMIVPDIAPDGLCHLI